MLMLPSSSSSEMVDGWEAWLEWAASQDFVPASVGPYQPYEPLSPGQPLQLPNGGDGSANEGKLPANRPEPVLAGVHVNVEVARVLA